MFIKYDCTADGKPIMVEVTEEVAEFLMEDKGNFLLVSKRTSFPLLCAISEGR